MIEFGAIVTGILVGIAIAVLMIYLYVRGLVREVVAELNEHLERAEAAMLPVVVERHNDQIFCYEEEGRQFICQGRDLAEIVLPDLHARGYRTFLVSAVSHEGLRELGFAMAQIVKDARAAAALAAESRPRVLVKPKSVDDTGFSVTAENAGDHIR